MITILILFGILIAVTIIALSKVYLDKNRKGRRKQLGGTWYYITYTYKRDMGMTRITEFEWIPEKELKLAELNDNFKILKTEHYGK
jgi:uncharacterized lipoprotein YehR (DUF1307 family)